MPTPMSRKQLRTTNSGSGSIWVWKTTGRVMPARIHISWPSFDRNFSRPRDARHRKSATLMLERLFIGKRGLSCRRPRGGTPSRCRKGSSRPASSPVTQATEAPCGHPRVSIRAPRGRHAACRAPCSTRNRGKRPRGNRPRPPAACSRRRKGRARGSTQCSCRRPGTRENRDGSCMRPALSFSVCLSCTWWTMVIVSGSDGAKITIIPRRGKFSGVLSSRSLNIFFIRP